ncbi:NAD-dependent epimerase/dehydratase family protein [Tahibacter soli]|uniref:NAD(P)H-binding protein n=1 Tax=Tahibacter soli TaxID=2983605 RepID=A0A9X4BIU7_9GAMM|nr:NAD-dependent epimerase/dehydratase family protein [Tahibacter soli]MDC8013978.1 NAD(P)H-binding protein [Tahibacter soli]
MQATKTALVLGATGGIGGEAARHLRAAGWRVKALNRDAAKAAAAQPDFDWMQGDAMRRDDVVAAARGADAIVHAVNPPGYRRWAELVLPMLDNTIAAAQGSGARIVLPGTVYNYGPDALPAPHEDSPQNPATRKGAIRAEMEKRLHAASGRGAKVLIVRAGDYFGPRAGNNWFSQALVKPGKPLTTVTNPARAGVGHQWAYLPDVAATMVRLLERGDALDAFCRVHMQGHWDADGTQMVEAIRRVAVAQGGARPAVKTFPWWALPLATPFVPLFRELNEMRYLWREPVRMDNARLVALIGAEPHTRLDDAVAATLAGLGAISVRAGAGVPARAPD